LISKTKFASFCLIFAHERFKVAGVTNGRNGKLTDFTS